MAAHLRWPSPGHSVPVRWRRSIAGGERLLPLAGLNNSASLSHLPGFHAGASRDPNFQSIGSGYYHLEPGPR
ncbi:hypothetical protein CUJ84_Chr002268 [Rhizobium leguminosarum]|uniref:Uncharacterized protein n=1 Tax=Rhizobium leguminosarum TaxID=384 RepID=A0A2K9Z2Z0_RHILE|nr:hypothetical protein CUJ84_Chr002268 [Rhizobium leguminosarum]